MSGNHPETLAIDEPSLFCQVKARTALDIMPLDGSPFDIIPRSLAERGAAVVGNSDFKIARDRFIDEVFEKHGRDGRIDRDGYRAFLHVIEHIKDTVDDWPAKWKV